MGENRTTERYLMRVGLDIGGTSIDAVAVGADGRVVRSVTQSTGYGSDEVVARAALAVTAVASGSPVESIGIGIPGVVDRLAGTVRHAVNLGLDDVPIGPLVAERAGVPVVVENDVNAAALGAHRLMGVSGSLAYLNLGTGLAAGIIVDGALWVGSGGVVGEIGHVPVVPGGVLCSCGQRGCLETIASGGGLARQWPVGDRPARDLLEHVAADDVDALAVWDGFADGVASAIQMLALTVGVDETVIGGGLSRLGAPLEVATIAALRRRADRSPFLASLRLEERFRLVPPGLPVASVGAALLADVVEPVPSRGV